MGYNSYEKHYLFTDGKLCCDKFFPGVSRCPEIPDEIQSGYYWETYQENLNNGEAMPIVYNHTYYPDVNAGTCVNGTDYPPWMGADKDFRRVYLFKKLDGCCEKWFNQYGDDSSCAKNVIQGKYDPEPCPENRPESECNRTSSVTNVTEALLNMWYPVIERGRCVKDGKSPKWMHAEGVSVILTNCVFHETVSSET